MTTSTSDPKIGDLIYCHAIGSKYEWYTDQLGVILDIVDSPKPLDLTNKEYKIWLMDQQRDQIIESSDFKLGNVEVLTKEKGLIMRGRTFSKNKSDKRK